MSEFVINLYGNSYFIITLIVNLFLCATIIIMSLTLGDIEYRLIFLRMNMANEYKNKILNLIDEVNLYIKKASRIVFIYGTGILLIGINSKYIIEGNLIFFNIFNTIIILIMAVYISNYKLKIKTIGKKYNEIHSNNKQFGE